MTASACEVGVAFGDFRTDDISASSLGGKEEANLDVRLLHTYKGEGDLHEMSEFLPVSANKQLHKCFEHLALSEFGSA